MIHLQIDGKPVEANEGVTVLTAARQVGIFIPTLCDHPALSPSGGCRLCMVEVQGARGPQAACTLLVRAGMVVTTNTPTLRANRQFVLSMLFSESTHICPFCPVSGGDCELQNAAYHEHMTHWPILPAWQAATVDASSQNFIFDPNRCILCRRCVRACGELVGNFTLGVEARGTKTRLVADDGLPLGQSSCVSCGTCVQVCPTGALFGRRDAYQGHAAQTRTTRSICVGCSLGCGIELVTRDGRLVRVDGDWNSPVSGGVLCRAGRYEPLEERRERILTPLVRQAGSLAPSSWDDALDSAALGLLGSASPVAGFVSARLPAEALTAFRQLVAKPAPVSRAAGSDAKLDLGGRASMPAAADLAALAAADLVVVFDADLERGHQVLSFMIKRNLPTGLKLVVIDPRETALDKLAANLLRPAAGLESFVLKAWLQALAPGAPTAEVAALAAQAGLTAEAILTLSQQLAAAQRPLMVFGHELLTTQPEAAALLRALAQTTGHLLLLDTWGQANRRAAAALQLDEPFEPAAGQAVFIDLGDEMAPAALIDAVKAAPFLVVQASYYSPLTELADVVLPVETWAEQSGHYLNLEGRLQLAQAALTAPAEVWPNVAVLAGLAERLGVTLAPDWPARLTGLPLAA